MIDPQAIADDTGGQAEKGLMNFGFALPTDPQSAKLMQPTQRAFDEPTGAAQSAGRVTAVRNAWLDTQPTDKRSQCSAIETFVGDERVRFLFGSTWFASHGGNLRHQRQCRVHVGVISRRQLHDQRCAAGVGQQAMLRARAAAIGRIRPGFCPPSGALTKLQSSNARDQSS